MSKVPEYAVRLFLNWLNERYQRAFVPAQGDGELWQATDPDAGSITMATALLYEGDDAWRERCAELEERLNGSRPGSYVLWQPRAASCRTRSRTSRSGCDGWC